MELFNAIIRALPVDRRLIPIIATFAGCTLAARTPTIFLGDM